MSTYSEWEWTRAQPRRHIAKVLPGARSLVHKFQMLRVTPVVAIARAARAGARTSHSAAAVVSRHARGASLHLSRPRTAPVSLQGRVSRTRSSRTRSSRTSHAVREVTTCRYGGYDPSDSMGETTAPERIFSTLPYLLPVLESLRYGARTLARRCRPSPAALGLRNPKVMAM